MTARSLADVASLAITSSVTVLSLLEIDRSVFEELSSSNWDALKLLLQEAGTILWVSSGRRADNPYANMTVGLLRSARQEIPTLEIQSFDIEGDQFPDAREIAEALLRFKAATMWQRREGQDSLLMTVEPELVLEQSTILVIPRLVESQAMNDRFNSSRRPIFAPASAHGNNINFGSEGSDEQHICWHKLPGPEGENGPVVRVTHSLRSSVRVSSSGFLNLVLGRDCNSDGQVVALASQHTLMVAPLACLAIPVAVPAGNEASFVTLLAYHLLASMLFQNMPKGVTTIIHEPDRTFAVILADEGERHGIHVVFTTSMTTPEPGWLKIHPMAPDRAVRALIPANTAGLFDLSTENDAEYIGSRLRAQLPSHCNYYNLNSVFTASSTWKPLAGQVPRIHARLKECVSRTLAKLGNLSRSIPTVSLNAITEMNRNIPHIVIDWSLPASDLSVRVRPTDSQVHFSNCKTYWLAGLSGGLGLLLCEWMVRHGAKYIVISSRTPSVEKPWLEEMHAAGAIVKVFSWFVNTFLALS
jgi:hybrid polyketide synthase/nonribosomal peptide synthetase ACE1